MDADTLKDSFTVFETGAALGDANSMNNLGSLYSVAKDSAKAREWYEKAADIGHPAAMLSLGEIHDNGYGVAKDSAKAREWYEKAADIGHPAAMLRLALLYYTSQDYAKARKWYEKAAEKGSAGAMTSLGLLYANGGGVAQDYAKAREWYEKAAEKGSGNAMSYLGALFANGHGVPQDYDKAREWYEKAADKGNAEAMVKLGWLYDKGLGVPQDYAKAREWYVKAAAEDDADAKLALERLPIEEAETTGRYAEALQLQEALAAKVEAEETKRDGKPGEQTAWELTQVIEYALFAKEFTKALTVANRSHALFPDDLIIETNRAHALMFMERGEEAKALYLAHKGKPLSEQDKQLWEQAIAEDFERLGKAGLTHPMMVDIEKELGVSPDSNSDIGQR
jgi:TPR repeat protein